MLAPTSTKSLSQPSVILLPNITTIVCLQRQFVQPRAQHAARSVPGLGTRYVGMGPINNNNNNNNKGGPIELYGTVEYGGGCGWMSTETVKSPRRSIYSVIMPSLRIDCAAYFLLRTPSAHASANALIHRSSCL